MKKISRTVTWISLIIDIWKGLHIAKKYIFSYPGINYILTFDNRGHMIKAEEDPTRYFYNTFPDNSKKDIGLFPVGNSFDGGDKL